MRHDRPCVRRAGLLESRIVRGADAGRVQEHLRKPHAQSRSKDLSLIHILAGVRDRLRVVIFP